MKYFPALLLALVLPILLAAQSESDSQVPRLSKMAIGQSGCSAYFPEYMPDFELSKSEDSSEVYTAEMEVGNHSFACIAVKFASPFTDFSPENMEDLLISYLDYLKGQFGIISAVGYGKGHTLESTPDARGIIDYWEDEIGLKYALKGWVNQQNLGIMIIYGEDEYPHFNLQQLYLDGFRFGD